MTETHDLAIAIPFYNEEGNVEGVLSGLCEAFDAAGIDYMLVPVDNGSSDETGAIIDRLGRDNPCLQGLHLSPNQGYGGGILAGMARCNATIVGYTWGDGQICPADHVAVYTKLRDEKLDICKIRRVERHDGAGRKVMTTVYNMLFPLLFRTLPGDVNGCPKMFRREVFDQLQPSSRDWFLDPELMIKAGRNGLSIGEVPAVFLARTEGYSKVNVLVALAFLRSMAVYRFCPSKTRQNDGGR